MEEVSREALDRGKLLVHGMREEAGARWAGVPQGAAGPEVRILPMSAPDLERVEELRSVVGWAAKPEAFDLLRGVGGAQWAVAELADGSRTGGTLAGMAGAVPLGEVGVLCHLAVRHARRNGGIGRSLARWAVAYLRSEGVRRILLDSTPQAEKLYRSLGFAPVGRRAVYRLEEPFRAEEQERGCRIEPLLARDLPELYGVDLWSFGGDRSALIFSTIRLHPGGGLIARDASGQIKGYLIQSAAGGTIRVGPFMAADEEVARSLLLRALRAGDGTSVEVTVASESPAHALLRDLGFTGRPDRLRMALGDPPATKGLRDYGMTPYLAT